MPHQLTGFYPDLLDERVASSLIMIHSRFSTNTFPSWPLAHPYRFIVHNGEINTIAGNRNWMRTRESLLASEHLDGLERAFPVCTPGASDTASFDEVLELLTLAGYSLPEAVLMMIPEPWENHGEMAEDRRAFYRYHATRLEPWDGPASIAFTDGTVIGAVLDRNGLRPSRYWVTGDDLVVMASEVGVLDIPQTKVVEKGRLRPGRMFLVDTAQGRIVRDDEIKDRLAQARPYRRWLQENQVRLDQLPDAPAAANTQPAPAPAGPAEIGPAPANGHRSNGAAANGAGPSDLLRRQQIFGYTHEEQKLLLAPMARDGKEAVGSMGTDTPLAVLSGRPRLVYDYFKQLFAQVTNPPLDAIREELVTSLYARVGPEANLLDPRPESCRSVHLDSPVITDAELARLTGPGAAAAGFKAAVLPAVYPAAEGGAGLERALAGLRSAASTAIAAGAAVVVLSDRDCDAELAPIPSLLATAAVHHHLVRTRTRTRAGLVVSAGDVREVHHLCLSLGYGANAVNPYLALETVAAMAAAGEHGLGAPIGPAAAERNYLKAAGAGILKVMSKMGISTVASYTGAQIFEAVGLGEALVEEYFTGTASRLGGIGLDELAAEAAARHRQAFPANPARRAHRSLDPGGEYQWRREGEYHLFNPETVFKLQHATRQGRYDIFKDYTARVDDQSRRLGTLRGLFRFRTGERPPVPLEEVEPASEIVKRFATGAMSYGSISGRGPRDPGHRHEPHGGQVQHRRGGRGRPPLHTRPQRRLPPQRGQAGGQRPLRGDQRIPGQRGRHPDQDGPGGQAGGGGPAPGPQGVPLDRRDPPFHPRRGADLAPAPPRHLLHRGPGPAHPRPQELQPGRPHPREAGGRGGGGHGGGRGVEGPGRRGADLRPRRRHRGFAAHLHQARRGALGAGAGRDPADPGPQRPAGPDHRPGRRPAQDRPRRGGGRPARGRGVRLRHRPAGGHGLRDDAGVPSRHLPGGGGHPEPRAAGQVHRPARVRGELLRVHRRRGAGAAGRAGLPQPRRGGGPGGDARRGRGRWTTGRRAAWTCRPSCTGPSRPGPAPPPAG